MIAGRFHPGTFALARASRQMTLSELSEKTDFSTPLLSRIENGSREVAPEEAEVLARALCFPTAAMYESLEAESLGLPTFYHRKLAAAGEKKVRAVESRCLMASIGIRNLLRVVDLQTPYSIPKLDRDDYGGDPEKAAAHVRLLWQLPRGPIANLIEVVERAGGLVIHSDFGVEKMEALYQPTPSLPPIFWMNSNKAYDRARFSLAHELGHVVMHHAYTAAAQAEEEANQFASAFLMPRSDFRGECSARIDLPSLAQLKQRWRVSMAAILRRAKDLNIISPAYYRTVVIRMSNMRKVEPFPISAEWPSLLSGLMQKFAQTCDTKSLTETADALRIPVEFAHEWCQHWPSHAEGSGPPRMRIAF